jgi:hypothetical protein
LLVWDSIVFAIQFNFGVQGAEMELLETVKWPACVKVLVFEYSVRPARPGRASGRSVSHRKSILYGAFVWARRALSSQTRRCRARVCFGNGQCSSRACKKDCNASVKKGCPATCAKVRHPPIFIDTLCP